MFRAYSPKKKAFCLEEQLGIVQNGRFSPVTLEVEKFKAIIDRVITSKRGVKKYDVLRKSMLIYLGVMEMAERFRDKSISQSILYCRWLSYIEKLESFQKTRKEAIELFEEAEARKRRYFEAIRLSQYHGRRKR